jgi:hypothetical protein
MLWLLLVSTLPERLSTRRSPQTQHTLRTHLAGSPTSLAAPSSVADTQPSVRYAPDGKAIHPVTRPAGDYSTTVLFGYSSSPRRHKSSLSTSIFPATLCLPLRRCSGSHLYRSLVGSLATVIDVPGTRGISSGHGHRIGRTAFPSIWCVLGPFLMPRPSRTRPPSSYFSLTSIP